MARLYQSGFELNSTTASVEYLGNNGTQSIVTTTLLSGSYASLHNPSGATSNRLYTFAATAQTALYYVREYIYITTAPSSQVDILKFVNSSAQNKISIRLNTNRTLQAYNEEDSATIGSASSALSLNRWYRLELKVDTTTLSATTVDALLDGSSFVSSTANLAAGINRIVIGSNVVTTTYSIFLDDIAINDSSGSFQNSWPGQGKIIHLRPNAAGDNTAWTGAYTDVDEVTPDDTTTKLSSNTLDQIEDMNIDSPSMMGDQDTVNVVAVGVRYNGVGASLNASFVLRIKASASGTVEESSAIAPTNATWVTNANAEPRNYTLVLYDLPGASTTAWTKNDLEQAQIGVRLSATSTNAAQVSTLWASVDYVPVTVKKWGVKPR